MLPSLHTLSLPERELAPTGADAEQLRKGYKKGQVAQRVFTDAEIEVHKEACEEKVKQIEALRYEAEQKCKEWARMASAAENAAKMLERTLAIARTSALKG